MSFMAGDYVGGDVVYTGDFDSNYLFVTHL